MAEHSSAHSPRTSADWAALHARLRAAAVALERVGCPDQAEAERILKVRARALARPIAAESTEGSIEVLAFRVGDESYAVEPHHVARVHAVENLTPIPGVPKFVRGVLSLHGEIVSVIDLRQLFGGVQRGLGQLDKVIVLRSAAMRFGVLADVLEGMQRVSLGAIQATLPTLKGLRERYLLGVTHARTVVLDAGRLLADRTLMVEERVPEEMPGSRSPHSRAGQGGSEDTE